MKTQAMRIPAGALLLTLSPCLVFPQSLGDLARREQERRQQVEETGVKVITLSGRAPVPVDARVSGAPRIETLPPAPLDGATGPAPAFTLEDREGRRVSLARFRGAPLLIDFWASWCGPCRRSMPAIEQLYRKYRERGLQVVGINIEGRSTATLDYLNAGGYTFPILFDSGNWNSPVARSYRVSSIPRTFLIDGDGNILFAGHPDRLPASMLEAALR